MPHTGQNVIRLSDPLRRRIGWNFQEIVIGLSLPHGSKASVFTPISLSLDANLVRPAARASTATW
jgi:hypothetical protein